MPREEEETTWSERRELHQEDLKEKEEARRRALEGLSGVNALLKKFSEDEDLRDDLKHPATRVALMHWTGEKRLPAEEFDKIFRSNYRLGSVLQKIRILQAECQKAGIPVPLDHMLRGDKELKIPGLEPPSKTAASGKGKAKGAAAAPTPVDDSDVKRVRPKRTSSADRRAGGVGSNGGGEKSVVDEVEAPIVPGWVSAILLPVVSAVVGLVIAKYLMPYVLPPAGAP